MFLSLCSAIDKKQKCKRKEKDARKSQEDKTLMSRGTEQKTRKTKEMQTVIKYK